MRPRYMRVRTRSANEGSGVVGWSAAVLGPACFLGDDDNAALPEWSQQRLTRRDLGWQSNRNESSSVCHVLANVQASYNRERVDRRMGGESSRGGNGEQRVGGIGYSARQSCTPLGISSDSARASTRRGSVHSHKLFNGHAHGAVHCAAYSRRPREEVETLPRRTPFVVAGKTRLQNYKRAVDAASCQCIDYICLQINF